jgi:predicted nuclease of predicted toxin-antitoxin system
VRLKLDENLSGACATLFTEAGLDATTVAEQRLCSTPDRDLIEHCRSEGRVLVTLDLDFANPLVFKPSNYPGIAVLRLPSKPSHAHLADAARTLSAALAKENIEGKLWIIQPGRVRVYQEDTPLDF